MVSGIALLNSKPTNVILVGKASRTRCILNPDELAFLAKEGDDFALTQVRECQGLDARRVHKRRVFVNDHTSRLLPAARDTWGEQEQAQDQGGQREMSSGMRADEKSDRERERR